MKFLLCNKTFQHFFIHIKSLDYYLGIKIFSWLFIIFNVNLKLLFNTMISVLI